MLSCTFNFYAVMYLLCRCICIFELATSCGQRTITFLSYSEAVVRLPCRATSRPNSRCRYKVCLSAGGQFDVKFIIAALYIALLWTFVVSCGFRQTPPGYGLSFRPCICRTSSVASSLNYSARRR